MGTASGPTRTPREATALLRRAPCRHCATSRIWPVARCSDPLMTTPPETSSSSTASSSSGRRQGRCHRMSALSRCRGPKLWRHESCSQRRPSVGSRPAAPTQRRDPSLSRHAALRGGWLGRLPNPACRGPRSMACRYRPRSSHDPPLTRGATLVMNAVMFLFTLSLSWLKKSNQHIRRSSG